MTVTLSISNLLYEELVMLQNIMIQLNDEGFVDKLDPDDREIFNTLYDKVINSWMKLPATHWTELSSQKTRKLASLSFLIKQENVATQVIMNSGIQLLIVFCKSILIQV